MDSTVAPPLIVYLTWVLRYTTSLLARVTRLHKYPLRSFQKEESSTKCMIPDLYHAHAHGGEEETSARTLSQVSLPSPATPLQRENIFIVSGLDIPPEGFRVFLRRPDSYYYYKVKSPAIENAHNACEGI